MDVKAKSFQVLHDELIKQLQRKSGGVNNLSVLDGVTIKLFNDEDFPNNPNIYTLSVKYDGKVSCKRNGCSWKEALGDFFLRFSTGYFSTRASRIELLVQKLQADPTCKFEEPSFAIDWIAWSSKLIFSLAIVIITLPFAILGALFSVIWRCFDCCSTNAQDSTSQIDYFNLEQNSKDID